MSSDRDIATARTKTGCWRVPCGPHRVSRRGNGRGARHGTSVTLLTLIVSQPLGGGRFFIPVEEFPMSMHSWIRNLFTRPVTRTIRKAPRRIRPALEALEDRTAPALVSYTNATGLLTFSADAGDTDNVTVTAPLANQVVIQVGNSDSISLAGDAGTNPNFVLS